jgi:hypothetical protein
MFVVAFEGAWLARKAIDLWVLELVFVFGFDPDPVERAIASADTWLELVFIDQQEENNMPLCWKRYLLWSEVLDLSMQFVLDGVVSLLVVRSYEMVAVAVLSRYLLAVNDQSKHAAAVINDLRWCLDPEVCRLTLWVSRLAGREAILTGRRKVGHRIIWPVGWNHGRGRWNVKRWDGAIGEDCVKAARASVLSGKLYASVHR